MLKKSPLLTLLELAQKDVDEATKRLGQATRAHEDAEKQYGLLLQYREDYAKRLQMGAGQGLSIVQYNNYNQFLQKLEHAISGQARIVQDTAYRVTLAKADWQETEKRRLSYDTLHSRNRAAQQRKEDRREQKNSDEIAARTHLQKRSDSRSS